MIPNPRPTAADDRPDCAVIEITLRCNFGCLHCGGSAGQQRSRELSLDELTQVARDLKRIGFARASLIGGEVFCRPDWLEVARAMRASGLILTYVSNGFLLPEQPELVDQIASTEPQVVGLSLDGGRAETHDKIRNKPGSYERVLASIDLLHERGVEVTIITTLNRLNVGELAELRELLLGRRVSWQIQVANANGRRFDRGLFLTRDEYHEVARFIHDGVMTYPTDQLPIAGADDIGYFSKELPHCSINGYRWHGCKGGITNLGIQSDGGVKGCLSQPDSFLEGNVRERSLYDIWHDPEAFAAARHFDVELLRGACRECVFGAQCKGGCPDIATSICGHPFENGYCLYANGR